MEQMINSESSEYICTLTPDSLEKAVNELHEDPPNRLGAVETLRAWIVQQKHMTCPTDTRFLLRFLRAAKFSQLRAREVLENYLTYKTDHPEWFEDIDYSSTELIKALQTGFFVPLPGVTEQGQKVILLRQGAVPASFLCDKNKRATLFKVSAGLLQHLLEEENTQVNGLLYMIDLTNMSMKHMTAYSLHETKELMRFQDSYPARFKGVHYYNAGTLIETIFALIKPFMKPKLKERIKVHGTSLEQLYSDVPKHVLPVEYLPDDYEGPKAGSIKEIIANVVNEVQQPEFLERLKYESSPKWMIDRKLKEAIPCESFRKLRVD